jgi:hypothetical protein
VTNTVSPPPVPPVLRTRRPVIIWDTVLSIVVLVVQFGVMGLAAIFSFTSSVFIDYCPEATCNAGDALGAVFLAWAAITVVGLAATIITIVRLAMRRISWPFAAVGFVLVLGIWTLGEWAALTALGTHF